jgi:acetyl-CoA carboxylase biotin carboxyl carrier protein
VGRRQRCQNEGAEVSDRNFTYQDLLQIVELIKSSQFAEIHLKVGDIEVDLKRSTAASHGSAQKDSGAPAAAPGTLEPPHHQRHGHLGGGEIADAEALPGPAGEPARRGAPLAYPEGAILIKSPMVGTFYRAPEPGAKPFIEVGSQVEASTVTCIIEVMKLMNSIPAGHDGVITHILVEDAEPVQYGQVLMVIEPRQTA